LPLVPAPGRIVGRDEAFPLDENAHHRAPNESQLLDPLERITYKMLLETVKAILGFIQFKSAEGLSPRLIES
jgi:hypothetical protein